MKLAIDVDYEHRIGVAQLSGDGRQRQVFTIIKKNAIDSDDDTYGVAPLGDMNSIVWRNDFYEATAELLQTVLNTAVLEDNDRRVLAGEEL